MTVHQIFDYMNVNDIHNATFAQALPPSFLEQARALANWHEYNVFSDPSVTNIGNSKDILYCPWTTDSSS
jgi:prostatic aicd phosphatase